jgi:hypothetical protein
MSRSQRPTRAPRALSASARLTATVDLPTPPLPLATAMMCLTSLSAVLAGLTCAAALPPGWACPACEWPACEWPACEWPARMTSAARLTAAVDRHARIGPGRRTRRAGGRGLHLDLDQDIIDARLPRQRREHRVFDVMPRVAVEAVEGQHDGDLTPVDLDLAHPPRCDEILVPARQLHASEQRLDPLLIHLDSSRVFSKPTARAHSAGGRRQKGRHGE